MNDTTTTEEQDGNGVILNECHHVLDCRSDSCEGCHCNVKQITKDETIETEETVKSKENQSDDVKRIDIKEFRSKGFLQEANRLFFHPLGLALEVIINEEDGSEKLGGVWDYRDDPEGMLFGDDMINVEKVNHVGGLKHSKLEARRALGCNKKGIQPIE